MKYLVFIALASLLLIPIHAAPVDFFGGQWTQYAKLTMLEDMGVTSAPAVYDMNNTASSSHDEIMVYMRLSSSKYGEQEAAVAFKRGSFSAQDFLLCDSRTRSSLGDNVLVDAVGYKSGLLSAPTILAQPGQTIKIESWHMNYGSGLNEAYDYEDVPSGGDYGSFQFFTPLVSGTDPINSPRNLIMAYNFWGNNATSSYRDDIGIGNNTEVTPHDGRINSDWTFSFNANLYTVKDLYWFSRDSTAVVIPEPSTLALVGLVLSLAFGRRIRRLKVHFAALCR